MYAGVYLTQLDFEADHTQRSNTDGSQPDPNSHLLYTYFFATRLKSQWSVSTDTALQTFFPVKFTS